MVIIVAEALERARRLLGTAGPGAAAAALGGRLAQFGDGYVLVTGGGPLDGAAMDVAAVSGAQVLIGLRVSLPPAHPRTAGRGTADVDDEAVDGFADAAGELWRRYGHAHEVRQGAHPMLGWRLPSGRFGRRERWLMALDLSTGTGRVRLSVRREGDQVGARDDLPVPVPVPVPVAGAPGWPSLARALAGELFTLEADDVFCLARRDGEGGGEGYVQFIVTTADDPSGDLRPLLIAEAVGDHYLPAAHHLSAAQRDTMVSLGWAEPTGGDQHNWTMELWWPGRSADYRRLADVTVRTLRDVYGAAEPTDLLLDVPDGRPGALGSLVAVVGPPGS